jgi:uroporphyrinogen decarboxylase
MKMHPRERALAAINHQPTDRAPADFSAHREVTERLLTRLGLGEYEELLQALGCDLRHAGWFNYSQPRSEPDADGWVTDMWGGRWRDGVLCSPFDDDTTVDDVLAHPWPSAANLDYSGVRDRCARVHDDYLVYGGPWCPFFHEVGWLIGQENYFVWMHTKPEVVEAITTAIVDYEIDAIRRYLEAADGLLDVLYVGNDFGTQRGLVVSPEMWERFLRTPLRRYFDLGHDFGCRVMQHSCGGIRAIIPDLLADGVHILDPIQVRAEGMDFAGLVRDFGDRLVLHGAVDTQHTLPFEDTEAVRAQVRAYRALTRDRGGYIMTGSQELIADIPDENILAMYEENARR